MEKQGVVSNRVNRKPMQSHRELEVYQLGFEAAMRIFESTKRFPAEEVRFNYA
jgi:hypothetical protein